MTANQRGAVAESMVCTWALSQGFYVSFPARGLSVPYDMIIDFGSGLQRVQVKRAYRRKRDTGRQLRVSLTDTNDHGYEPRYVDAFAVVDVDGGRIWYMPIKDVSGMTAMAFTTGKWDNWMVYDERA